MHNSQFSLQRWKAFPTGTLISILLAFSEPQPARAQDEWVTDPSTGCRASLADLDYQRPFRPTVLQWTGQCKNGKVDGFGTLTLWDGNRFKGRMYITKESGLRMTEGGVSARLDLSEHRIVREEAFDRWERATPQAVIYKRRTEQDYRYWAVIKAIAQHVLALRDSLQLGPKFKLCFRYENNTTNSRSCTASLDVALEENGDTAYHNYENDTRDEFQRTNEAALGDSLERVRKDSALSAQAARVADSAAKANELERRLAAFLAKDGVGETPDYNLLRANPFNYQGQTVAYAMGFGQMLSPTKAIFKVMGSFEKAVVVSDVPEGKFKGGENVALAGRVIGTARVTVPMLGKQVVPHLKYVESEGMEFVAD